MWLWLWGRCWDVDIYVAVCLVMHGSINEIEKMRKGTMTGRGDGLEFKLDCATLVE